MPRRSICFNLFLTRYSNWFLISNAKYREAGVSVEGTRRQKLRLTSRCWQTQRKPVRTYDGDVRLSPVFTCAALQAVKSVGKQRNVRVAVRWRRMKRRVRSSGLDPIDQRGLVHGTRAPAYEPS